RGAFARCENSTPLRRCRRLHERFLYGDAGAARFPAGGGMTSIYDALQRVRQGGRDVALPDARPAPPPTPTPSPPGPARLEPERRSVTRAPGPLAAELTPLLATVRPLLDDGRGAVVHFVAATAGEGTSTMAREFAMLAATTGRR